MADGIVAAEMLEILALSSIWHFLTIEGEPARRDAALKRNMKRTLTFLVFVFVLSGCLSPPTRQQLDTADYGAAPADYQALITSYMNDSLKDPDSARFKFYKAPRMAWYGIGSSRVFGWAACVDVNAKNSYGGYTGMQAYYFLFRGNAIVREVHDSNSGGMAQAICADFK